MWKLNGYLYVQKHRNIYAIFTVAFASEIGRCHLTVLDQGEHIEVRHIQEAATSVSDGFIQVLVVLVILQRREKCERRPSHPLTSSPYHSTHLYSIKHIRGLCTPSRGRYHGHLRASLTIANGAAVWVILLLLLLSLFIYGAGVKPSPLLLRRSIGLLYQPWVIDDDCGAVGVMNEWQGKQKCINRLSSVAET
jgi:hypothetical protein